MKKILLLMVAALFLCGVTSAQNWGTPDSHAKSSNTPIVAKVTLGETVQETGTLGAFVGDSLRGLATIHTDGNFWIQAFYNEGETNPDEFTFKFYDGQQEYTNCTTTLPGQEEGYGTPNSPVELVFANEQTMTQTTQFAQGWSWWSTPVEMNGVDGLTMLENSIGADGNLIRTQNGLSVEYLTDWEMWWGDEFTITNEAMYEIKMNNAKSATLSGVIANPTSHPITISNGWNWIGYPKNTSMEINAAFASLSSVDDDIIQMRNGEYSVYISGYGFWGDFENVNPGNGYKYKYNGTQAQTFTFPSNNRSNNVQPNNVAASLESSSYQYMMNVIASVTLDDTEIFSEGYEITALCNGEPRGTARLRYCEPIGKYIALITVFSDKSEQIQFSLRDDVDNSLYLGNETVQFESEKVIGSLGEPYPIHFGTSNARMLANMFPNPTNKGHVVRIDMTGLPQSNEACLLEIFNSTGERVALETSASNPIMVKAPNIAGIYHIRLTVDGESYYGKLVVID